MKSWEENLQLANHQKAYLLMLGESKEVEVTVEKDECNRPSTDIFGLQKSTIFRISSS